MSDFRDYLEEQIDLHRPCELKFRANNGAVATVQTRIRDVYREAGVEYLKTEDDLHIRMDAVLEVNGRPAGFWA